MNAGRRCLRAAVRGAAAATFLCATFAAPRTAGAEEAEFPLGPIVRAGRPVVVRVPGARRVRVAGSPWALPVGGQGDEFVVQTPHADTTLGLVEVEDGSGVRSVRTAPRPLPAGGSVAAAFGGDRADVVLPPERLPTTPEAWLVVDEVGAAPEGLAPAERAALETWRAADLRAEPLLFPPDAAVFAATRDLAAGAPRLPRDVATALLLLALAEAALVVLVRSRAPMSRALWLAAPPVAALAWLLAAGALPGPVRVVVLRAETGRDRLVVARFEAVRDGTVSFRVPEGAWVPALLRFDADDRSAADAEAGREVRLPIPAGGARVVAWRLPSASAAEPASEAGIPSSVASWLARRGLRVVGVAGPAETASLLDPRGFVPLEAAAVAVEPPPARK
jgi:hypothetical protein